jgi:hypothetical protein
MTNLINAEVHALLDKVRSVLDGDEQERFFAYIGGRVGVMAEGVAREYPAEPNGRPLELFYDRTSQAKKPYKTPDGNVRKPGQSFKSKFKTQRQQGAVILKMRTNKGGRTGLLGNSITHAVVVAKGGAVVTVGTNLDYAEHDIGSRDVQNHYHQQTGWQPLDENIERHVPEFRDEIVTSGSAYLKGYLSK